jgi:hypothetical protein
MARIGAQPLARALEEGAAALSLASDNRLALGKTGLPVIALQHSAVKRVRNQEIPIAYEVGLTLDRVASVVHAFMALAARLADAIQRPAVGAVAALRLRGRGR